MGVIYTAGVRSYVMDAGQTSESQRKLSRTKEAYYNHRVFLGWRVLQVGYHPTLSSASIFSLTASGCGERCRREQP